MTPEVQALLNKELLEAARIGNTNTVKKLIKEGAEVNAQNAFKRTPLHLAAEEKNTEIVQELIEAGADINLQDDLEETALHKAAYYGHTKIAEALIEAKADINAKDKSGGTPLHQAAAKGHTGAVKALTAVKGVNLNSRNLQEETPLHIAAKYGKTEIAKALIEAGVNLNSKNLQEETPLHIAAKYGKTEIAEALIEAGANVNLKDTNRKTALDIANTRNNEVYNKIINALAEKIKNNDEKRLAFAMGNHGRLGEKSLFNGLEQDLVKQIIKEAEGMTLNNIKQKTHREAVKKQLIILQPNKFVGSHDELNKKLLEAAKAGNTDTVKALIKAGADIKAKDAIARTPIHWAAINGYTETVEALINAGADINAQNNIANSSLLHLAARKDYTETANLLIEKMANVNLQNKDGETPLHIAACYGHTKTGVSLIEAGANVNLKDTNEKTALDMAKDSGDEVYNKIINALAQNIIKKTKANGLAFAMATHNRLGANSLFNNLEQGLVKQIIKEAEEITPDNIPKDHLDAVSGALKALQKNAGPHAAKVAERRRSDTLTQSRS